MEVETSLPIIFSFSGGKDSCLSIYRLKKQKFKIISLITTITECYNRVSIHGIREELIMEQAKVCINENYEKLMEENMLFYKNLGIDYVGFGDIFLEDIRNYREKNLSKIGMNCYFPLWKEKSENLINEFIELGFKAIIVCVDLKVLDISFLSREIDKNFKKGDVVINGNYGYLDLYPI